MPWRRVSSTMIRSAPKAASRQSATTAQPLGQQHEQPCAGQGPYPDRGAAQDHREHEIDRALEAEIARLDIDVMMGKERAGDCSDGRAQTEGANFDQRRIEADKAGGGLVVMHGPHLQP